MLIKYIFLAILGICGGGLSACGFYAIVSALGIINRYAHQTHTAAYIGLYEWMIIGGAFLGAVLYLFEPHIKINTIISSFITTFMGIFIGCFLMALQEAVNGIPVFARRIKLKSGMGIIITAFAVGKGLGSILFFYLN